MHIAYSLQLPPPSDSPPCHNESNFLPASLARLHSRSGREKREFASHVCRNCDARYSCASYRSYAQEEHDRRESALRQYLDDYGTDLDQQDWLSSNLEVALTVLNLD